MKAWTLYDIGDIRYEDIPAPKLRYKEALIRVCAAGICGSDIPRIYETGAHRMPLICGHEFSGVVEEVATADEDELIGKRVAVYPLIPCMECDECKRGRFEMCRSYDYIGSRSNGAFSEYVAAPCANLMEIPKEVGFPAAAMLEPAAVALHAIRQVLYIKEEYIVGGIKNETADIPIAVIGAGTIGLMTAGILVGLGFDKVFLIGNKPSQRELSAELSIHGMDFCDSSVAPPIEWLKERTGGRGARAVFECVGKASCVSEAVFLAEAGGNVVLIGNPLSDMTIPKEAYGEILRKQLRLCGTWNSSFIKDWKDILSLISKGVISPERIITHTLKLSELKKGLHIMRDKTEAHGKIMIKSPLDEND